MDFQKLLTLHRRELHKIPELGRDLPKTKAYIKSVLDQLDCQVVEVMESGLYAYFDRGKDTTTAFRADMDALPVTEVNQADYTSLHEGRMHACGHDGHMAMVLTMAQYVDTQKELPANVLCIFQPAEETTGGAKEICETGVLETYHVDRIFGVHMWPFLEAGRICSKGGPMMPRSSEITIEVFGRTSHATAPENGIDALLIGCRYIEEIYALHQKGARPTPRRRSGQSFKSARWKAELRAMLSPVTAHCWERCGPSPMRILPDWCPFWRKRRMRCRRSMIAASKRSTVKAIRRYSTTGSCTTRSFLL